MLSIFRIDFEVFRSNKVNDIPVSSLYFPYDNFIISTGWFHFEVVCRGRSGMSYRRIERLDDEVCFYDWVDYVYPNPKTMFFKMASKVDENYTVITQLMVMLMVSSEILRDKKNMGDTVNLIFEETVYVEREGVYVERETTIKLCKRIGQTHSTGTGVEKSPHLRRRHKRTLKDGREIWIDPIIVRADKGTPTKGHIYEV